MKGFFGKVIEYLIVTGVVLVGIFILRKVPFVQTYVNKALVG